VKSNEADKSSDLKVSKFVRAVILLCLAFYGYLKDVFQLETILETKQKVKDALCLDLLLSNIPVKL